VAYGFEASAATKSDERGGFLPSAFRVFERVGPCMSETGEYPRLSEIFGDLPSLLKASIMQRAFAGCAARWPVDVTCEALTRWLPVWGLASEEEAAEVVSSFDDAFLAALVAAERTQTLLGVAFLCAQRLDKPLRW